MPSYTPKAFLRRILPKLDNLVPARLTRLKAVSSNPFGGYIDVCNYCGYGQMRNIPSFESLAAYYSGKYWQWRSRNRFQFPAPGSYKKDNRALHQIEFVKHIFKDPSNENSKKKILEIGAAGAIASLRIRDTVRGEIELNVCEPGSQWLEYYKSVGISRVAEFFPFESKHNYDYIHTSHWLEHVGDIELTMNALSTLLKPGGCLFIEVPNTEYHYWDRYNIDTPHIHFFTKKSLSKLLANHGFSCEKIEVSGLSYPQLWKREKADYSSNQQGAYLKALFRKELE